MSIKRLADYNVADWVPELLDCTSGISEEFDRAILKVEECLDWEDEGKTLDHLGEGWIGEEAVVLALYCFLRYPNDFRKVVLRGANTNGYSDSIACIAGSISGAFLGIKAIPKKWIKKIEKAEYLDGLAERLSKKSDCLEGYEFALK